MSDLNSLSESVSTREEFSSFVRALQSDLIHNAHTWQNGSLDSFLEAMAAWVDDMDGYYRNKTGPMVEPSWTVFAHILAAARLYE